jgi:hypothetical protein
MFDPFAEMEAALAASALGADATWISKAGGPGVSLRVVPSRPEAAFEVGAALGGKAIASTCVVAAGALPGDPIRGDLIAFNDQGFVVERVEQDSTTSAFTLYLRRQ